MNIDSLKHKLLFFNKKHQKELSGNVSTHSSLLSDDNKYRRHFLTYIGPEIYKKHLNTYFICCSFCSNLTKSSCHKYCFSCSKKVYDDCSLLLPGTYEHVCDRIDNNGEGIAPWIFRTPCTDFERLNGKSYFKHFTSGRQPVAISNYEALEGIFLGMIRGKRPCHICASVKLDIYNNCISREKLKEESPCEMILNEIAARYSAILGMIKYFS